jgi:cytochrome c-type biogenesis protein CcmH
LFEFSDLLTSPLGFLALLILMSVAAMAAVAWPLIRKPRATDDEAQRLIVLRDRRREIEIDREQGKLSQAEAELAVEALAQDLAAAPALAPPSAQALSRWWTVPMVLVVPILAWVVYAAVGAPAIVGIDQQAMQGEMNPQRLQEAMQSLRERVEKNPQDREGWLLLGQAYRLAEDLPAAANAFRKAADDPRVSARLLAELAETVVLQNQGNFQGEPLQLLERAYQIDPKEPKTMGLLGAALYRTGQPDRAIKVLQALIASLPPDSEQSRQMMQVVDRIKAESAGGPSASAATPPAVNREIRVLVSIDPAALAQAPGTGALFVTARAAEGPRQPIAVQRLPISAELLKQLAAGEVAVILSSANLMDPQRGFDAVPALMIDARLSASGQAIRQTGDWLGSAAPQRTGALEQARVVIRERVQ